MYEELIDSQITLNLYTRYHMICGDKIHRYINSFITLGAFAPNAAFITSVGDSVQVPVHPGTVYQD